MAVRRFVESRGNDLSLDAALHIRDFLGPLVNKQDEHDDLPIVRRNGIGYFLQDYGFSRFWRGHDQPALASSDRSDQVHKARGKLGALGLKVVSLIGMQGGQVVEKR